jgi:hypothetical protein
VRCPTKNTRSGMSAWNRATRRQRLAGLIGSSAFASLRERRLRLTVLIANPFSDFVRIRAREEKNDQCRYEILRNVELLHQLSDDLAQSRSAALSIDGTLAVGTYDCNPYVSVFKAHCHEQDFMEVGFLFQGRQGRDVPRSLVDRKVDPETWDAVNRHFDILADPNKSPFFFRWGPHADVAWSFKAPETAHYDVFLCYNHQDADRVGVVEEDLRRAGIACWFDQSRLHGGDPWMKGLEAAISRVRAMAVFLGPQGDGRWQEMEIRLGVEMCARRNLKIVPVVLPGVKGEPDSGRFIDGFQRIDLRRGPQALQELVEALRS